MDLQNRDWNWYQNRCISRTRTGIGIKIVGSPEPRLESVSELLDLQKRDWNRYLKSLRSLPGYSDGQDGKSWFANNDEATEDIGDVEDGEEAEPEPHDQVDLLVDDVEGKDAQDVTVYDVSSRTMQGKVTLGNLYVFK